MKTKVLDAKYALELGKRIREVRGELTQKQFAEKLGILYQHLGAWETGKKSPGAIYLRKIAEVSACNVNWLLTGKGDMMITLERSEKDLEIYKDVVGVHEKAAQEYKRPRAFPVVSHASANPHGNIDWEPIEHEYVEIPPHAELVRVEDDSMSPTTLPGQFVWIDRQAVIRNNDLVVAKVKGHPGYIFKRISHDKATDTVALSSVNQAAPLEPIIVRRDRVKEIYLVTGSWYLGKRRPERIIKFE